MTESQWSYFLHSSLPGLQWKKRFFALSPEKVFHVGNNTKETLKKISIVDYCKKGWEIECWEKSPFPILHGSFCPSSWQSMEENDRLAIYAIFEWKVSGLEPRLHESLFSDFPMDKEVHDFLAQTDYKFKVVTWNRGCKKFRQVIAEKLDIYMKLSQLLHSSNNRVSISNKISKTSIISTKNGAKENWGKQTGSWFRNATVFKMARSTTSKTFCSFRPERFQSQEISMSSWNLFSSSRVPHKMMGWSSTRACRVPKVSLAKIITSINIFVHSFLPGSDAKAFLSDFVQKKVFSEWTQSKKSDGRYFGRLLLKLEKVYVQRHHSGSSCVAWLQ